MRRRGFELNFLWGDRQLQMEVRLARQPPLTIVNRSSSCLRSRAIAVQSCLDERLAFGP